MVFNEAMINHLWQHAVFW